VHVLILLLGAQRAEEKERADPPNAPEKRKSLTRDFFLFLFSREERADPPNAPDKKTRA
jgi:hypothetical protein